MGAPAVDALRARRLAPSNSNGTEPPMRTRTRSLRSAAWLAVAGILGSTLRARASTWRLLFSGSFFNVSDPSDVFLTTIGNTYTIQLNYDPDLLPATPSADASVYTSGARKTSSTVTSV